MTSKFFGPNLRYQLTAAALRHPLHPHDLTAYMHLILQVFWNNSHESRTKTKTEALFHFRSESSVFFFLATAARPGLRQQTAELIQSVLLS